MKRGAPLPPAIEARLTRELRKIERQIKDTLPAITSTSDVSKLERALKRAWPVERIRRLFEKAVHDVSKTVRKVWKANEVGDLKAWIRESTERMMLLMKQAVAELRARVREGSSSGVIRVKRGTLAGQIKVLAAVTAHTAYATLTTQQAQAEGGKKFIWRTMGDNRVRPEHQAREGKTYNLDDPPSGGLPGEPINCRCWMEVVI